MQTPWLARFSGRTAGLGLFVAALLSAATIASLRGPKGWPMASIALGLAWALGVWWSRPDPDGVEPPARSPLAAVLLLAATTFFTAWHSQPTVTVNDGYGWDGLQYHAIYQFIGTGEFTQRPIFPFHQRLGVPAIASFLPLPERSAFLVLGFAFYAAALGLLARFWLVRRSLRADLVVAACGWLCLHWISPLRAGVCYPINIDASTLFFDAAFFAMLWSPRLVRLLPLVALVAALFKESALLTAGLWLASTAILSVVREGPRRDALRRRLPVLLAAVLAALLAKTLAGSLITPRLLVTESAAATLARWIQTRADHPLQLVRLLSTFVNAYGGWLLVPLAALSARPSVAPVASSDDDLDDGHLLLWLALWIGVTFISGSDLSRFAWQAAPVALTLALSTLHRRAPGSALALTLTSLGFVRLFTAVPSPSEGHLMPADDYEGAYSWMMETAHYSLVAAWAVFGVVYWLVAERVLSRPREPRG
nr:hypothetical protein [Deltaproteobacteria bacterium]